MMATWGWVETEWAVSQTFGGPRRGGHAHSTRLLEKRPGGLSGPRESRGGGSYGQTMGVSQHTHKHEHAGSG